MKVLFMGTPEFAAVCLKALAESGHEVVAAVTQPDRPVGRGKKLTPPPVKQYAESIGISVLQPERIKAKSFMPKLLELNADIFVVAAYGQILSESILNMTKYGAICVHASLLPKYRGASPIQQAIADGETTTGITIMQMDAGIDTGDMLLKCEVPITENDTGGTLHDKLCNVSSDILLEALERIENGTIRPEKQDNNAASYAPIITKDMAHIDWTQSAARIVNLVRAYNPFPGAFTVLDGKSIKLWQCEIMPSAQTGKPGEIIKACPKEAIFAAASDGIVRITSLTPPNGKKMAAADFVKGYKIDENGVFV